MSELNNIKFGTGSRADGDARAFRDQGLRNGLAHAPQRLR